MSHILNQYFDHVFVIIHPDSLRYMTFNQRWHGLQYNIAKFVKQNEDCISVDGFAEHNFTNIPTHIPLHNPLSTGQVACALAHILIYKNIIDKKLHNCLILEDDSIFNDLSNLDIALKSDYDILALFTADCDLLIPNTQAAPFTSEYTKAGTSAYTIKTPEAAKTLYDSQINNMDTADGAIRYINLNVYAVYPPCCSCDDSPSIIVNGLY
jgi:GR25 family glycosyltransferase involved in LPS biosynthesis